MSAGDVLILNTKLDILIDDFRSFKRYALGFLMTIAIPFAVYIVMELSSHKTDLAVMKEQMNTVSKAIKEEQ